MLIVISDTHFAESTCNQLGDKRYNNNLPSLVFHNYFQELSIIAQQHAIQKIDLVLAGDIFEVTRTSLWLIDDLRPYISVDDIKDGSRLEERILDILNLISQDENVNHTLELFRNISGIIGVEVQIHFVPGNHDRLLNSTPKIRQKVRNLLGMPPSDMEFENVHFHPEDHLANVLIRHGHEYDSMNFSIDIQKMAIIPSLLPKEAYASPPLGDFITVDIATRLPVEFKKHYSIEQILSSDHLLLIYERLIEFDNVRPASALLNFLLSTPGIKKNETWHIIEPVIIQILNSWAVDKQLSQLFANIPKHQAKLAFLFTWFIGSGIRIKKIPYWAITLLLKISSKRIKLPSLASKVRKEAIFEADIEDIRCLVMGHTHVPEVKLIKTEKGVEEYYINTGTWRKLVPATPDLFNFGHLRTLTKAIIFDENEHNAEYGDNSGWSFDFNSEIGYGYEIG